MIKSVIKALDTLELLAGKQGAMSLSELAEKLSQNINTVKGLLNTLQAKGYVKQETARGRYRLGGRVLYLAESMDLENNLKKIVYPYLEELHDLSGKEAVYCSLISGTQIVCLNYIDSDHVLGIRPDKSYLIANDLHVYSQGKLILGNYTEKKLEQYLKRNPLKALTVNSITDKRDLLKELVKIRKTGLSFVKDESSIGISSLAAGLYSRDGRLFGSIAVSFPTHRLPEDYENNIGRKLVEFAEEVSKKVE